MRDTAILVSDFCLLDGKAEQYRLSKFERLTLVGGEELEKALQWISAQVARLSEEQELGRFNPKALQNAYEFYTEPRWKKCADSFFIAPASAPQVREVPLHGLADGEIVDLEFESAYRPHYAAFRSEFAKYKQNKTVYARMWRHREAARGTIIAIHGWTMGDQRINALAFQPGYFYSLGLDVVLVELPYHGRRNDGVTFPGTRVARTNEGMAQAISDLRQLKCYLESKGSRNIGSMGISLGGYTAALWASLDELAFCVAIVPMVCMGEVAWEIMSRNHSFLKKMEAHGFTEEHFKEMYRLHSPLSFRPKLPVNRRVLIAGLGDQIVSPRHPHRLWEHWDSPKIHWLCGGHVAQFKDSRAFREIAEFFASLGLSSRVDADSAGA